MVSERASQRAFFAVSALLFAASAAVTIVWCASMSAMGEMPMPGGWTMSMAWMRMPGQTWPGAAASFLGMWVVMMVAMMLPSLVPMLWRYRQAVGRTGETRLGRLTALVGVGTSSCGPCSEWPPFRWASRWRQAPGRDRTLPADDGTAWRHGLRRGLHCSYCCADLTAILLVIGVMELRAMAVVAAAITVERLAPAGERGARAIGAGGRVVSDRASSRARMTHPHRAPELRPPCWTLVRSTRAGRVPVGNKCQERKIWSQSHSRRGGARGCRSSRHRTLGLVTLWNALGFSTHKAR
jgi:hypothetical protein